MKQIFIIILLFGFIPLLSCSGEKQITQGDFLNSSSEITTLTACPKSPNCINTQVPEDIAHFISPYSYLPSTEDQTIEKFKQVIIQMGGKIEIEKSNYLHAVFASSVFKFIDDFEVLFDEKNYFIHVRSASRSGYYDFGVNKKRTNRFYRLIKSND